MADENHKIVIKRRKKANKSKTVRYMENFEEWLGYWRENPHRFWTDYLGLTRLYGFQQVLLWMMFKYQYFIFAASRGLAKSTLTLIFATIYAILYPGTVIVVVAPVKSQSQKFIKKIQSFANESPNLRIEIESWKFGANECSVTFTNGSEIIAMPYGEQSRGVRANILIVDEYALTDEDTILTVFVPMLTDVRTPPYNDLTEKEKERYKEDNKQLYLSSIRGADEWSYKRFVEYVDWMTESRNTEYITVALPYNIGVRHGYIQRKTVEQSFRTGQENIELLLAEYTVQPIRGTNDAFYKFNVLNKARQELRPMVAMTDAEYAQLPIVMDGNTPKRDKTKWQFYLEKLPNEIRILSMDVALVSGKSNDNTAFWVLRLIPNSGMFVKKFQYCETMNGVNSLIQCKRAKQLFYELDCDYFVIDGGGVGQGILDVATTETDDYERGEKYPAWTVMDSNDIKNLHRTIDSNAVPVVDCVKTSLADKSRMLVYSRDLFSVGGITLLCETLDGQDYLNQEFDFYKIDDQNLRTRVLQSYAQTSVFINEAINLRQVVTQGRISAEEKSGKRKDRVMSMVYALDFAKRLEDQSFTNTNTSFLDYICFA